MSKWLGREQVLSDARGLMAFGWRVVDGGEFIYAYIEEAGFLVRIRVGFFTAMEPLFVYHVAPLASPTYYVEGQAGTNTGDAAIEALRAREKYVEAQVRQVQRQAQFDRWWSRTQKQPVENYVSPF